MTGCYGERGCVGMGWATSVGVAVWAGHRLAVGVSAGQTACVVGEASLEAGGRPVSDDVGVQAEMSVRATIGQDHPRGAPVAEDSGGEAVCI